MAGAHNADHDYHLVDPSPWPALASLGAFIMAIGAIGFMRWNSDGELLLLGMDLTTPWIMVLGLVIVLYTMFAWWRDTIKEAHEGYHTRVVSLHLRYGMILFIASEVMFFVAWFWAFFDASLFPGEAIQYMRTDATGGVWPPAGIETFDPWHLPLFNTIILLTSGTTVTWAHHALLHDDRKGLVWGLTLTVALGALFSYVQAVEYSEAAFAYSGNIYGATFFMATGFHGFHVFVGTIFLLVCLIRALKGDFTPKQHFGFEAAAWYWHFVDVVWLFLFVCVYIWGGGSH
ncbi:Cytochrome c oxidase subunit 3 [Hartmannibacter diazotrophicus]|uniref:Cytochrome c oxidase subunit 3 n=1 Tax=Hartmannibacter diazotrophicus TaxID=1482074 RepID=A0A2C9D318_9HYPH|nr:cytochrome c oxidase subunit 3 [Hartmannibacter diazotrophicus]SON54660.1 Cytochrome c oxidase subunit 3 [Hartmannibacter diazotrophicus]